MDIGKLILDEIVGPAGAFFSVRDFASFGKGNISSSRFAIPWNGGQKKKNRQKAAVLGQCS
jgi:hypothetical protein